MEIDTTIGALDDGGVRIAADVTADKTTDELRAAADVLEALEQIEESYNEAEPRTLAQTARVELSQTEGESPDETDEPESVDVGPQDEPPEELREIAEKTEEECDGPTFPQEPTGHPDPDYNGGDEDEYECPECGKTFDSEKALYGHTRVHSEDDLSEPTTDRETTRSPDSKPEYTADYDDSNLSDAYKSDSGFWVYEEKHNDGARRMLKPNVKPYQTLYLAAWLEYKQKGDEPWTFSELAAEFEDDDEVPTGNATRRHAKNLRGWGVVEIVGKQRNGSKPTALYRLTDRGWSVLTEHGRPAHDVPERVSPTTEGA